MLRLRLILIQTGSLGPNFFGLFCLTFIVDDERKRRTLQYPIGEILPVNGILWIEGATL